jgi:hypothetical protein
MQKEKYTLITAIVCRISNIAYCTFIWLIKDRARPKARAAPPEIPIPVAPSRADAKNNINVLIPKRQHIQM